MRKPSELRKKLFLMGVSQTEIAEKADVSIAFINRIIWGKDKPSAKTKQAFCEITGLNEKQLFGGEDKVAS